VSWLRLVTILFSTSAFAQSSVHLNSSLSIDSIDKQEVKSRTVLNGTLKAEASGYTSEIPNRPNLSQSFLTTMNVNFQNQSKSGFQSKVDVTFGKYVDWGGSYFGVQEIYTSYQFSQLASQISIGRKIEYWSQIESDWQLGLWEPKYTLDALRPVNQGLTGVFYKVESDGHDLLIFGAPIFLPTMGPEIREQDGALVADSRWYKTPSRSSLIINKNTELLYSLNVPDLMKLVSKPGMGFRYRYGATGEGAWGSVNFAHKPINSLLLKYDAQLVAASSTGKVTVSPEVGYHNLWGWDLGYYLENGMISMSYIQDDPETIRPETSSSTDWVVTQPGQLKIYGIHLETSMPLLFSEEEIGVSFDYIRVSEVLSYDVDSQGGDRGSLFPYRTQFTNALSMKGRLMGVLRGKPLMTEFKLVRDFDQKGSIFGVEWNWRPTQSWTALAGIDVLTVDNSTESNMDPRFINQFRANDRLYTGVGYVF